MDYVREGIEYLKSYNDLIKARDNLADEIRTLRANNGEKSVNLDGMPHGSNGQSYDDHIINNMFKLQKAEANYKDTTKNIARIDKILEDLSKGEENEKHGKLLRLWFIEQKKITEIADELNISDRHVFRVKNIAIRRLAIQLFGIKVIK